MTGPEGTQFDNEARVRGSGTAYQVGQIHGDASMGNIDNSRRTTVSLGTFGVVVGVVMTLVVGFAVWKFVVTDERPDGSPAAEATTSSETRTPPDGVRTKEVRLTRGTGADVDGNDVAATPGPGAVGEIDLHLGEFNLLRANGGGFHDDRGPEQQAQQRCAAAVAGGKYTAEAILPAAPGTQHCFATSDGQVGWLRVKSAELASVNSDAFTVLAVRVWRP
ncbi:hypothetical protein [Lentzea flaviverrucosa]|uniref:Uncharacterized protein n=1 Tax=Lentzea flaviverrucosa TaxID=200379 RepID=A0A1H9JF59_9PSEU|nr:hypothetical protein [Lentzea flaviverrucosa]RDI26484.1 hypothetical protein DFR72_107125 [Lentzea flaviverrucosa]SEQ85460.1 hypothetical protein SAMN05216195_103218 [Lentzea flaviverrucosa]